MVLPTPNPATNKQLPDHAILDYYNKQAYLGNAFMANSGIVALATTSEVPFLYMANAAANSVALFNGRRRLICDDVTGLTGIIYRIYIGASGVSGGSAAALNNLRPANPNTSVASILISPTVVSKGSLYSIYNSGWNVIPQDDLMLILDPDQNMLITAQATASTSGIVDLDWYEL